MLTLIFNVNGEVFCVWLTINLTTREATILALTLVIKVNVRGV